HKIAGVERVLALLGKDARRGLVGVRDLRRRGRRREEQGEGEGGEGEAEGHGGLTPIQARVEVLPGGSRAAAGGSFTCSGWQYRLRSSTGWTSCTCSPK